ncbi:MAG: FecR domain-containing protein, partial [Pyrinomonadaceae bacterium]
TGLIVLGVIATGIGIYIRAYGNPFANTQQVVAAPAGARFLSFEGDVRVVRAQTRENLLARSNTQLYPGDIVQTQGDGRARIQLADDSTLIVRPNSVVTIRDNQSFEGSNKTNVRVAIARGQINVRTEQLPAEASNIVETPLTRNNLTSQTGASFGVRDDNTEDIRVSTGAVDTSTRGGEKTTVRAGEYVALNQQGNVRNRERLLEVPGPQSPRDLERIAAGVAGRAEGTNVLLRWRRPASGAPGHYRVEVATSPFFVAAGKVIERDQLGSTEFNVNDLRPGAYYWRVRAVAASGQISDWSEPQKFTVESAGGAGGEQLFVSDVTFELIGGQIYLARGLTQAGNTVRINGREAIAGGDGAFQLQISVPGNEREVTVEVADSQGGRRSARAPLTPHGGR